MESEADGALPPRPLRLPPRPLAPRRRTFLKDSLKVGSAARFTGSPRRGMPVHTGAFISPANSALMHSFLSMSEAALLSVSAFARRATERGEGVNIAAPRQNIRCGAARVYTREEECRRIASRGPSGATAQDGATQPHHTARFPKNRFPEALSLQKSDGRYRPHQPPVTCHPIAMSYERLRLPSLRDVCAPRAPSAGTTRKVYVAAHAPNEMTEPSLSCTGRSPDARRSPSMKLPPAEPRSMR